MKCSHGLPYEVKCPGCFKDAMERISASQQPLRHRVVTPEDGEKIVLAEAYQMLFDKARGLP